MNVLFQHLIVRSDSTNATDANESTECVLGPCLQTVKVKCWGGVSPVPGIELI